jgi:hypothetical protein
MALIGISVFAEDLPDLEKKHIRRRTIEGPDKQHQWPEAYGSSLYNAHLKGKLDNRLNKEISQKKARKEIAIAITGPGTSGVYPRGEE